MFLADVDWSKGLCSGMVYSGADDLTQLMSTVSQGTIIYYLGELGKL